MLSGAGIEPVPEKLQALKEMAEPDRTKGVKIYLGFVGYYRKFGWSQNTVPIASTQVVIKGIVQYSMRTLGQLLSETVGD